MTSILLKRTGALGDVLNTTPVAHRLRLENPDAIIHIDTEHQSAYLNNPDISGFKQVWRTYDRTIDLTMAYENRRRIHQVEAYFEVAFGDRKGDKTIVFEFPRNSFEGFEEAVALHPGVSWPSRTLPREFWQSVADALREEGFQVVTTGTRQDWELTGVTDLRGKLTLRQQASLIDACSAFVCSDSGPMTLAQATSTPIIGLFTITLPEFWLSSPRLTAILAKIACVGCGADQKPSQYFECWRGDNACTQTFGTKAVVDSVLEHAKVRPSPHPVAV